MTQYLSSREFFQQLSAKTMHLVDDFYSEGCRFQDPIVDIRGRMNVKNYYANMYKNVESIDFIIHDEIVEDNKTTLVWRMDLTAKKLNGGKPIQVEGVSVIHFNHEDGKAIYHRDYFDMGAFVYEGLPLVGGIIRYAKKKMASHHQA